MKLHQSHIDVLWVRGVLAQLKFVPEIQFYVYNLQLILGHISKAPNQIILTGIQGEDLEKIVSKFSNFKRINL